MFTPWNIHCETNTQRGQIKHTWLENQLCNKSAHDVLGLWWQGPWSAMEKEFEGRLGDALRLSDDLEAGFSPAQLVDRLTPFAGLSEELKMEIKQAVHAAYLESSGIADLKAPLRDAATTLGESVQWLRKAWLEPNTDEGEASLCRAWEDVSQRAHALLKLMEQLPKGVVLP